MPVLTNCPCCPKHCPLTAPHCGRGQSLRIEQEKQPLDGRKLLCPGCEKHCRLEAPLCGRGAEAYRMVLRGELEL